MTSKTISKFLLDHVIVFWLDGQPLCKIKRSDFGFEWPVKSNKSKEE